MGEELYHIYSITNKVNGKMYIGQSKEYKKRWKAHIQTPSNMHLKRAFDKYGLNNFEFQLILCTKGLDNANYFEKMLIEEYDTFNNGYNLTKGGDGTLGRPVPEEQRKRISYSQKGEKCKLFGKRGEACHNFGKNNGMYGVTGSDHPKSGYKMSEESLLSMIDKKTKYRFEQYTLDGHLVAEYARIQLVVDAGFSSTLVHKVCTGVAKSHRGYVWKRFLIGEQC